MTALGKGEKVIITQRDLGLLQGFRMIQGKHRLTLPPDSVKYMAHRRKSCSQKGFPLRARFQVRPGVTQAVSEKLRIHAAWNLDSPRKVG